MEPTDKTTHAHTAAGNGRTETRRMQSSAHETVDRAARGAHDTVDKLAEKASRAASTLGDKGEQLGEQKDRIVAKTRTYVETHPVASIGIAVAAGFLLSRILRSDSHY